MQSAFNMLKRFSAGKFAHIENCHHYSGEAGVSKESDWQLAYHEMYILYQKPQKAILNVNNHEKNHENHLHLSVWLKLLQGLKQSEHFWVDKISLSTFGSLFPLLGVQCNKTAAKGRDFSNCEVVVFSTMRKTVQLLEWSFILGPKFMKWLKPSVKTCDVTEL